MCNGFAKFAVIIHIHIIIKRKNDEKIEIAKKSLEQNIGINTISVITGLTIEEIKKLKV